jgi:phospholipase B1
MPEQANMLIKTLKSDPQVRYYDDWKLVTLFVGGNDLCDACNDQVY